MRKVLLLSAILVSSLFATDPEALHVKSVYILKMGGSLDQFLASELVKSGVYTVTTDPLKADALFTDSLGVGFEKKMEELYPPPPVEKPEETKDAEKSDEPVMHDTPVQRVGNSAWGRGKGTVFLVERKSRTLLWSMNRQTKGTSAQEMANQAQIVVSQLKKDLKKLAPKE